MGKLLKGGEPDIISAAKIVLQDWQRGKIPYYVAPPKQDITEEDSKKGPINLKEQNKSFVEELRTKDYQQQYENDLKQFSQNQQLDVFSEASDDDEDEVEQDVDEEFSEES